MSARKKVLLVDDEPDFTRRVKPRLEERGYEVRVARNGKECRAAVAADPPDLIVLDIMMSTPADGVTVARDLRQNEATRNIPILVVTWVNIVAVTKIIIPGLDELWSPDDGFLEKPVEPQRIVEEVVKRLAPRPSGDESGARAGGQRVLVVDDELGIREGCRKILEADGYAVETAGDGEEGLARFDERGDFAAVLVDLRMPKMSGLELIEEIRERDDNVVLLVITAYGSVETAVEATRRGAYDYVQKPFTPEELLLPLFNGLEQQRLRCEAQRLHDERERRLLELAAERSKSTTIIECMTDPVIVVNCDGQIVLRNAAARQAVPGCEAVHFPTPLCALELPELEAIIGQALDADAGPLVVSRELAIGDRTFLVHASPVREPNDGPLGAVAVFSDITELKDLAVSKAMFVSMVAHEVKSPLGLIEEYLAEIEAAVGPQEAQELANKARTRAAALRAMVGELTNLAAIETGHFVLTRAPLDLAHVAAEAVEQCRDEAKPKGIELTFQPDEAGPHQRVLADREAMVSVLTNLIDNAIKYTARGGRVVVRVARSSLYARVSVEDNGIGMSQEDQAHVFDEFFRVRSEQTAGTPGTGLGLTLAKRLVDLHHGRISVESAPGKGSTFEVRLPLAAMD